jgi:ABC-type transporter Mla maintaining outer membrane lipid asymmetry ATPase subunit MlaF
VSHAIRFRDAVPAPAWGAAPEPLNLDVPEGALCVLHAAPSLFGPLLRACAGLLPLASGSVEVLGVDPTRLSRRDAQRFRRRLGVGLRPGGLMSNQTLRMNVVTPLLYSGIASPAEAERRASDALASCGLARWGDHRPDETPPDVRQAAVLARALARRPEVLLLEDPLSSVDSPRMEQMLNECRRLVPTILVASHRWDPALARAADLTSSWNAAPAA